MNLINKEELLDRLEQKYGDLTDDGGCSISTNNGYEWLSVSNIVELAHDCQLYDEFEYELEEKEKQIDKLKKQIEELKADYEKRLDFMQTAILTLSKGDAATQDTRVSKADFLAIYQKALNKFFDIMDGEKETDKTPDDVPNDIYGHDITIHWHGIYCNCGDGATPSNIIIPAIEDVLSEDDSEY